MEGSIGGRRGEERRGGRVTGKERGGGSGVGRGGGIREARNNNNLYGAVTRISRKD